MDLARFPVTTTAVLAQVGLETGSRVLPRLNGHDISADGVRQALAHGELTEGAVLQAGAYTRPLFGST